MKRRFAAVLAVAFALPVAGLAAAADEKKPAPVPAAEMKGTPAPAPAPAAAPSGEKKASTPSKPKAQLSTGTIEAVDAAAGTFTVKGKRGNLELVAGEKVKLADFKVGDRVVLKHADGKATSMKAVKGRTVEKKAETKASEKKAPAPASTPPPAVVPAPVPTPAPAPAQTPKPAEKK